ncbi:phosphatase PAP2 family protein [Streptomyces sp. NBC_01498]|uniref:bifunctional glycosyltransferase 87/phosphatase PAP2 family protein n=1 Tax=Streptomyces sp. NBC_01498 TaxID=2975870 RepID=UPI002E7BA392|nr:bifunctional glycosyltransferase 87/phosphatase PAP2 family protein [Streptomyces sp. NBC_01498]WTL27119.1 phosphatase PAP2 family protein [Streptomyces sp. NBC_01498]
MANAERGVRGGTVAGSNGFGAARALLWALAAGLAVRQAVAVLRLPPGERLLDLETWTGENGVLHVSGSLYESGKFTGTPFAGLVLKPLGRAAEQTLGVAWTFGTLLLVVALGLVAARALPGVPGLSGPTNGTGARSDSGTGTRPGTGFGLPSRRTRLLAAPVAISLLMLSLPVRNSFHLGQTSIIPVLLVLLGFFAVRGDRGEPAPGILIGLGAALQPAVLLFAPLLWLTGRRRQALTTLATFAACTALAGVALPSDSWTYVTRHLAGAGLGESPDSLANQSLHGALLRFGLEGPLEIALFVVLAAAVCFVGLRRAARYALDGQPLLAVALTGCVAVAVSPTAWQHQLLWLLLAVVGRVGTRAADRPVWPVVVVIVMTLPGRMMLPNMTVLHPVRDNVLLIAALAAACAVPFLTRESPYFAHPVPTEYAKPVEARWRHVPLAPFWRRLVSRPNLLLELLAIRVGYSVYSHIRAAATGGREAAESHAHQIVAVEEALGIDIERWVNHAVVKASWAEGFFDFYYTSFHFVVPLSILAVLYVRRPADYRWARASLAFATLLALLGFWLYPLAPPRLMPGLDYIDTVHGPQDLANPDYGAMTTITNQYAAMPSLHFGWSLWCGIVIVLLAPKLWMKLLGLLHPLFTVCAIVATANHWVLDAAGGAVVVGVGFTLTYVLSGPRRLRPAETTARAEAGALSGTDHDGTDHNGTDHDGRDHAGRDHARTGSDRTDPEREVTGAVKGREPSGRKSPGSVTEPEPRDEDPATAARKIT